MRRAQTKRGVLRSTREGGTMIEYEDEDPQINRDFEAALARNGVQSSMPSRAGR